MNDEKILHICKRLVLAEKLFNSLVDELLESVDLTREEVKNGYSNNTTST